MRQRRASQGSEPWRCPRRHRAPRRVVSATVGRYSSERRGGRGGDGEAQRARKTWRVGRRVPMLLIVDIEVTMRRGTHDR